MLTQPPILSGTENE